MGRPPITVNARGKALGNQGLQTYQWFLSQLPVVTSNGPIPDYCQCKR